MLEIHYTLLFKMRVKNWIRHSRFSIDIRRINGLTSLQENGCSLIEMPTNCNWKIQFDRNSLETFWSRARKYYSEVSSKAPEVSIQSLKMYAKKYLPLFCLRQKQFSQSRRKHRVRTTRISIQSSMFKNGNV